MTDLKPCPFPSCGSEKIFQTEGICPESYQERYQVVCIDCKAKGPIENTPEEAAEKWNAAPRRDEREVSDGMG